MGTNDSEGGGVTQVARCRCGMPLPYREDLPTKPKSNKIQVGDPKMISLASRESAYKILLGEMPDRNAALAQASGMASDHRRLVAFVYLLLRDNMTFGLMESIMQKRAAYTPAQRTELFGGGWTQPVGIWTYVNRLTGLVDEEPRVVIAEWVAIVFRFSEHPEQIPALIDSLPVADDTETVLTNGWLAQYAKYVVKELDDARP